MVMLFAEPDPSPRAPTQKKLNKGVAGPRQSYPQGQAKWTWSPRHFKLHCSTPEYFNAFKHNPLGIMNNFLTCSTYLQPTEDSKHSPNFELISKFGPTTPISLCWAPHYHDCCCWPVMHAPVLVLPTLLDHSWDLRASSPLSFFLVSSKKKLKGVLGSLVEGVPRKGASQTNLTDPTVKGDVPLLTKLGLV